MLNLNEANLSHLCQKFKDYDIASISASRGIYNRQQKRDFNKELRNDLMNSSYEVITTSGGYPEEENGETREVKERSFFVVNYNPNKTEDFENFMFSLCKKYNQDSIFIKTNTLAAGLYDKNRKPVDFGKGPMVNMTHINSNPNQEYYSRINGSKFSFESVEKSNFRKLVENILTEYGYNLDEGDGKVFDKDSGYNSSDDEEYYWNLIKKKWPDAEKSITLDFFRNPENNRPWQIDAYIPSEKTMIFIQKHIKHGRRPYNPEDPNCQADVEWLKSMPGEFYDKMLYTWTELDPLKRKIAAENGYKIVEIFNSEEFDDWYNNPELTYEEYKHAPDSMQYDREEYFKQKEQGHDIFGNDSNPHYHNMDESDEFKTDDIVKSNGKVYKVVEEFEHHGRSILKVKLPIIKPDSYIDVNNDKINTYKVDYAMFNIPANYFIKGTEQDLEDYINSLKR